MEQQSIRSEGRQDGDLVLSPNCYAAVLDTTKGKISIYVGPTKQSLSNTDQLVAWDEATGRFVPANQNQAVKSFVKANKGQYVVLSNPASAGSSEHPPIATNTEAVTLDVGRKTVQTGPASFALWPGQSAQTIEGHHLRHNQYLIVRVYDSEMAQQSEGIVETVASEGDGGTSTGTGGKTEARTFTMGQLDVIQGTDVSFYIPPSGIEVVPDQNGKFVRDAITLETLEYCILLDENGEKRYVQGPDVVFPSPTEKFVEGRGDDQGKRKFRAIELNEHSGIYVKVIEEYTEGEGAAEVTYKVGQELFITGDETPIYYPRKEHSIIQYGDKSVHYAIALPAGEGRYVLNKDTGEVDLIVGPKMFLPDPRNQVVVVRVLDDRLVGLLFPDNDEALEVNRQYGAMRSVLPSGSHLETTRVRGASRMTKGMAFSANAAAPFVEDESVVAGASAAAGVGGDVIKRSTSYTGPRTLVLDTKYEGAVSLNLWPGYAVMITDRVGNRRVEVGPKVVLMRYDETVMPMRLSTGKPKTTDRLLDTAYLKVTNNLVSDIIIVETRDLVKVKVKVSYRANFEGTTDDEKARWWDVENYVKVLTDHCRSRLRNAAKRVDLLEFYTNTIDIVRDTVLGTNTDGERAGLLFPENGLRVYDVEVLTVDIQDDQISDLLIGAQTEALAGAIQLSQAEESAERNERLEELTQRNLKTRHTTTELQAELTKKAAELQRARQLAEVETARQVTEAQTAVTELEIARKAAVAEAERIIDVALEELRVSALEADAKVFNERLEKLQPLVAGALTDFGDQTFVKSLVEAIGPAAMAAGVTTGDLLGQLLAGTPFEGVLDNINNRPLAPGGGGLPVARRVRDVPQA